jgi:uncharacterized coiled-coil DUF342 family protein
MSQTPTVQKLKQNETEIAVLQVQYGNLNEKVGDLKTDLKDLRDHIDFHMETTHRLIRDFQEENKNQHVEVNKKVSALEKWRWMLIGAGVLAGALGWPAISKLLGM